MRAHVLMEALYRIEKERDRILHCGLFAIIGEKMQQLESGAIGSPFPTID